MGEENPKILVRGSASSLLERHEKIKNGPFGSFLLFNVFDSTPVTAIHYLGRNHIVLDELLWLEP